MGLPTIHVPSAPPPGLVDPRVRGANMSHGHGQHVPDVDRAMEVAELAEWVRRAQDVDKAPGSI